MPIIVHFYTNNLALLATYILRRGAGKPTKKHMETSGDDAIAKLPYRFLKSGGF